MNTGPAMEKLLSAADVSEMTGIPRGTLGLWRHQRTGPRYAKLGGKVVYRESDITAWINEQFELADAKREAKRLHESPVERQAATA